MSLELELEVRNKTDLDYKMVQHLIVNIINRQMSRMAHAMDGLAMAILCMIVKKTSKLIFCVYVHEYHGNMHAWSKHGKGFNSLWSQQSNGEPFNLVTDSSSPILNL